MLDKLFLFQSRWLVRQYIKTILNYRGTDFTYSFSDQYKKIRIKGEEMNKLVDVNKKSNHLTIYTPVWNEMFQGRINKTLTNEKENKHFPLELE